MPSYLITDQETGVKLKITGASPPSEEEAVQLFDRHYAQVKQPVAPDPMLEQAQSPHDFSAGQMIRNIPASSGKYLSDLAQPFLHPIETAKGMQSIGQGLIEKMLPTEINGVEFGPTQNEQAVDAVGSFVKDRYGSVDAFKKTLEDDPVGVLADAAGVLTLGAGAVSKVGKVGQVAGKVQKIGAAIEPINATVSAIKASKATSVIPKNIPRRLMDSAFKFTETNTAKRIELVDYALENSMLPHIKQLEKNLVALDDIGRKINDRIRIATEAGTDVPINAIFVDLATARKKFGGVQIHAVKNLSVIDNVAKEMMDALKLEGKTRISPADLQKIKTNAYKDITWDRINQSSTAAKDAARRSIAKSSRKALEKIDPELADLNKEWGALKNIEPQIERSVNRFYNSDLLSLGGAAKIGASHVAGGPVGAGVGVTAAFLGKSPNKARVAIILENLRRLSEAKKLIDPNLSSAARRSALLGISRAEESLKELLPEEENGSQ